MENTPSSSRNHQHSRRHALYEKEADIQLCEAESEAAISSQPRRPMAQMQITISPGTDATEDKFNAKMKKLELSRKKARPAALDKKIPAPLATPGRTPATFNIPLSYEEKLEREFIALTSWANVILHSASFDSEIDLGTSKQDASRMLQEMLLKTTKSRGVEAAEPAKKGCRYTDLRLRAKCIDYLKRAESVYRSTPIPGQIKGLVDRGEIGIKADIDIYANFGVQTSLLSWLFSLHPFWLFIVVETVCADFANHETDSLDARLPFSSSTFAPSTVRFVHEHVLANANLMAQKKCAVGTVRKLITEKGRELLHKHCIASLLSMAVLLELAKCSELFENTPGLFVSASKFKTVSEFCAELSRLILSASGMPLHRAFDKVSFRHNYRQSFLEEYRFVMKSERDVADGIILGRLVELLTDSPPLSIIGCMRNPQGDRIRKKGNMEKALLAAAERAIQVDGISVDAILVAKRCTCLDLMWRLVGVYVSNTTERQLLRRESIGLARRISESGVAEGGDAVEASLGGMADSAFAVYQQLATQFGCKLTKWAELVDGVLLCSIWQLYNPTAPDIRFYEGDSLFEKSTHAAESDLGIPAALTVLRDERQLGLFAHMFLSKLISYKQLRACEMDDEHADATLCAIEEQGEQMSVESAPDEEERREKLSRMQAEDQEMLSSADTSSMRREEDEGREEEERWKEEERILSEEIMNQEEMRIKETRRMEEQLIGEKRRKEEEMKIEEATRKEEEQKIKDEESRLQEERRMEEARKMEERTKEEEKRVEDEKRMFEESSKKEEMRIEETRRIEKERMTEEEIKVGKERTIEEERKKEEEFRMEEARRLEEERRKEEERWIEEERMFEEFLQKEEMWIVETKRIEEERMKEEEFRIEEAKKMEEEEQRLEEERKKEVEIRMEKERIIEQERRMEEEIRNEEEMRMEKERIEEEERRIVEKRRLEEKRRMEEERKKEDEIRIEETRRKEEEAIIMEEERRKGEELKIKKEAVNKLELWYLSIRKRRATREKMQLLITTNRRREEEERKERERLETEELLRVEEAGFQQGKREEERQELRIDGAMSKEVGIGACEEEQAAEAAERRARGPEHEKARCRTWEEYGGLSAWCEDELLAGTRRIRRRQRALSLHLTRLSRVTRAKAAAKIQAWWRRVKTRRYRRTSNTNIQE